MTFSLTVLALPGPVDAADIAIGPGGSIQAAIDGAADGPATTTIDGGGSAVTVTCNSGEGPGTILDGFTVTGGNGFMGGGMYNMFASPTVRNCVFLGNSGFFGGGVRNENGSPGFTNCRFLGNTAFIGAGMSNSSAGPVLVNCVFSGNAAQPMGGGEGGGMDNQNSSPTLVNCSFTANQAGAGGAVHNNGSSPTLSNCVLRGNSAVMMGDEVDNAGGSAPVLGFCNVAGSGGSAGWDGTLGTDGGGNLDADPMFAGAAGPDGTAGTADDDLRLTSGSPCVDAGDNTAVPAGVTADLDGLPRFTDDPATPDLGIGPAPVVDMGAYELFVEEPDGGGDGGGGDGGDGEDGLELDLDLLPCTGRNVLSGRGLFRAAVMGTKMVAAESIDRESLRLRRADGVGEPIAPWKTYRQLRDVGSPDGDEGQDGRGCRRSRDGIPDLLMRFRGEQVYKALELFEAEPGTEVELVLEGQLQDGTPFTAADRVRLGHRPGRRHSYHRGGRRRH